MEAMKKERRQKRISNETIQPEDGGDYDDENDLTTKLNVLNDLVVEEDEVDAVQITRIPSSTFGATQDEGEKEEVHKSSKEWPTSGSADIFLDGDWNTTKLASDGLLSKEDVITERDHLQEKTCGGTEEPLQKPLKSKIEMLLDYMFNEEAEDGRESAVARSSDDFEGPTTHEYAEHEKE
ncbi:hypothetical protein RMATCC62417_16224 [Rhizopus microsporus]|nr:hypothetical protein RMATCC62417_16224 [Rhizopus microsporus]